MAQENPNMGFDPNWISFKPIRIIGKSGSEINTNLLVRNYLNKKSTVEFELNLPEKWAADFAKQRRDGKASEILKISRNRLG